MEYYLLSFGFALITVLCGTYTAKCYMKKSELGKLLGRSFLFATLLLVTYTYDHYIKNENVLIYLCSVEHIYIDWVLMFATRFIYVLTRHEVTKGQKYFAEGIIVIDSVVLATNPINRFACDFTIITDENNSFAKIEPKLFFFIHIFVCACMLGTMLYLLVKAILRTSKFYKVRYRAIAGVLIGMIVFYAVFMLNRVSTLNLSGFSIGIGAVLFYYSTYYLAPSRLIKDLQGYADENISDATMLYDSNGKLIKCNAKAEKLFAKETVSFRDELTKALSIENAEATIVREIADHLFEILYKPVYDEKDHFLGTVVIFHDITEERRQVEREHRAAIFDRLTGCFNRVGFFEAAPSFIRNNKNGGGYAVMVSGIRDFKGINGLYGTKIGDRVLIEIADRYHKFHHEFPMLYARTAEGKFTCIVPFDYLDTIVNEMSEFCIPLENDAEITVEMCHGFVVMNDMAQPVDYYYELAVLALAKCKKQATLSVLEYSSDMAKEQKRRLLLMSHMREAFNNKEFFIELQPQIDLNKNNVCGAEALVRWKHPTMGVISPVEFIPLFEDNGFITEIDRFVWDRAAAILKDMENRNVYDGSISVNVSQIDIVSANVSKEFENLVKKYDIDPSKLHVEITESACADNRKVLIQTMERLREAGFVVEIDDFGSGYSSLNALMHLPFDVVKLDMDFMKSQNEDRKRDTIVNAMSEMIHKLGAKVIVEGVETEDNVANAVRIKSDAVQGYLFSKPISVESFEVFVENYGR